MPRLNFSLRFDTLARYLVLSSLFYLALPYLIFFMGWLKWYLAFFCAGLVVLPLLHCIREIGQDGADRPRLGHSVGRVSSPRQRDL